ncbi:MAG TPA: hypothetical protein VMY77_18410 [Chitinophagaceae bacterium]|nr:hypothetical protein [Chitinophagaceae bacterium]
MKKIKLLLLTAFSIYAFSGVNMAYGFSVIKPVEPSMASVKYLKASEFVKLSAKDYTALTGKKLNFFQRLSFNLTKVKMKHDLKKNPDLKVTDYINGDGRTFQIDILWLLLGFLAGLGVLFAYITNQEQYKITSAWIGFGLFLLGIVVFGKSIF